MSHLGSRPGQEEAKEDPDASVDSLERLILDADECLEADGRLKPAVGDPGDCDIDPEDVADVGQQRQGSRMNPQLRVNVDAVKLSVRMQSRDIQKLKKAIELQQRQHADLQPNF